MLCMPPTIQDSMYVQMTSPRRESDNQRSDDNEEFTKTTPEPYVVSVYYTYILCVALYISCVLPSTSTLNICTHTLQQVMINTHFHHLSGSCVTCFNVRGESICQARRCAAS